MNNHERAENIVDRHRGVSGWTRESAISDVAAQIDEAVKEYATQVKEPIRCAYDQGYAAAREQAAKAVEFQVGTSLETAFDRALVDGAISVIRAMVPPGDGK